MKLQTLKPRLKAASVARVPLLLAKPGTVERKRGSAGVKDRNNIKKRDFGLCQACRREGRSRPGHVVDHIKPLWNGGTNDATNLELLCTACHDRKTAAEAGQRARGY